MIDSRCGLHCTTCTYKEPCGCGGCIETNGHRSTEPALWRSAVREKGFYHCGECRNCPVSCYGAIHAIEAGRYATQRTRGTVPNMARGNEKENRNVR